MRKCNFLQLFIKDYPMSTKRHMLKEYLKKLFCYLPLSDRQFIELLYLNYFHHPLHLDPPVTFNEKIQWLKLFGSTEFYTNLVDKYAVREFVASRIGNQYLNDLYGVFDHESDIDFGILPNRFVLKATHGSGWNIFCKDKSQFDSETARRQMRKWLASNFYRVSREPNYKNISPRIICEHYIEDENHMGLLDYKFFCFHGHVQYIQVDFDRYVNHTRNMYDTNWILCPFTYIYPNNPQNLKKPNNYATMVEVAEALAGEIPFVRVDLYNVASTILFGELTFTPESGFGTFHPAEWDYNLGTYLHLPNNKKTK